VDQPTHPFVHLRLLLLIQLPSRIRSSDHGSKGIRELSIHLPVNKVDRSRRILLEQRTQGSRQIGRPVRAWVLMRRIRMPHIVDGWFGRDATGETFRHRCRDRPSELVVLLAPITIRQLFQRLQWPEPSRPERRSPVMTGFRPLCRPQRVRGVLLSLKLTPDRRGEGPWDDRIPWTLYMMWLEN